MPPEEGSPRKQAPTPPPLSVSQADTQALLRCLSSFLYVLANVLDRPTSPIEEESHHDEDEAASELSNGKEDE